MYQRTMYERTSGSILSQLHPEQLARTAHISFANATMGAQEVLRVRIPVKICKIYPDFLKMYKTSIWSVDYPYMQAEPRFMETD